MKNIHLIALVAVLSFFSSCRKDEVITTTTDNPPTPIHQNYTTSEIYGQVYDRNDTPIADATVTWGGSSMLTDENGFFKLNSTVKEHNAIIRVKKEGYFEALQTLQTIEGDALQTKIQMTPRTLTGTIQSSGGSVQTNEGATIAFANGFKNENGESYTGNVNVFAYFLDPTIDDLKEVMPGNLTAINTQNEQRLLKSFGMINVELEDDAGNPLQIENPATLTTPVPTSIANQAPSTIPLWYFDMEDGTWREEGEAILEGNNYIGQVEHFTWWNVDEPLDFVFLEGQITVAGAAGNFFEVTITNLEDQTQGVLTTTDKGNFAGFVPKNATFSLEIRTEECGTLIYNEEIGPFSTNTNLGDIDIEAGNLVSFTISGTVVNCDGNAVSNGYILLSNQNNQLYNVIPVNSDGTFTRTIADCDDNEITYIAVDADALVSSPETTVNLASNTNLGEIAACGQEVEQRFSFTLDGETVTWASCQIAVSPTTDATIYEITTTDINSSGQASQYVFNFLYWENNGQDNGWACTPGTPSEVPGYPLTDVTYGFYLNEDVQLLQDGQSPGSLIHMILNNSTVERMENGQTTSFSDVTIEIKAIVQ